MSGVQEVHFVHDHEYEHHEYIELDPNSQLDFHSLDEKRIYACDLCGIRVTSANVLRRHLEGRKHQTRFEREGKTFECFVCEVVANSQSQLDAHLRSTKHKNRLYKQEHGTEMHNKGVWIILFCIACIFLNFLLMFKSV